MKTRKQNIQRRIVIEAYAKYDHSKKSHPIPNFEAWDWSQANTIDVAMCIEHLKIGIPAGYLLWDEVEITMSDFLQCAVDACIFPNQPRNLGSIDVGAWEPRSSNFWYEDIKNGRTLDEKSPMLFREAVRGESPARWYVEDGSGRAIAFVKNQQRFGASQTLAIGYSARKPDPQSYFLQKHFPELLAK